MIHTWSAKQTLLGCSRSSYRSRNHDIDEYFVHKGCVHGIPAVSVGNNSGSRGAVVHGRRVGAIGRCKEDGSLRHGELEYSGKRSVYLLEVSAKTVNVGHVVQSRQSQINHRFAAAGVGRTIGHGAAHSKFSECLEAGFVMTQSSVDAFRVGGTLGLDVICQGNVEM